MVESRGARALAHASGSDPGPPVDSESTWAADSLVTSARLIDSESESLLVLVDTDLNLMHRISTVRSGQVGPVRSGGLFKL